MINRIIIITYNDSEIKFTQGITFNNDRYKQNNAAEKFISDLIESNINFSVTIKEDE